MNMDKIKRILALTICLLMTITSLPVTQLVFADVVEKVIVETTFDGLESGTVYNGFDPKDAITEMGSTLSGSATAVTEGERSYINTTSEHLYVANLKHCELVPYGLDTTYDMMHISYDILARSSSSSGLRASAGR